MAKAKVKLTLDKIPKKIQAGFKAVKFDDVIVIIKDLITKGVSPVQGGGRFKRYSQSYRDAIDGEGDIGKAKSGKKSPVDMTLSGEMMDSLNSVDKSGKVFIEFDDPKAVFHNDAGAGKSKVIRRLLPNRDGESFSRNVQRRIYEIIREIVKDALK